MPSPLAVAFSGFGFPSSAGGMSFEPSSAYVQVFASTVTTGVAPVMQPGTFTGCPSRMTSLPSASFTVNSFTWKHVPPVPSASSGS